MMFKKAVYLGLISAILTGCGPGLKTLVNDQSSEVLNSQKNSELSVAEADFLTRINALRAQYDLPLLQVHSALQAAARGHSAYMNATDLLSHSEPAPNASSYSRIMNAGGDFGTTGENIACGNESAERTFNQWFGSAAHLRNMLSVNYQYIGIARVGYYWTTDFAGD